jgi:hypothetical protein
VQLDRVQRGIVDRELEPRREDDRPQHADRILEKANLGIANRADDPGVEVLQPACVIDDRERPDIVEERIDREVAPERVFFGRAVGVVAVNEEVFRAAARPGSALGFERVPRLFIHGEHARLGGRVARDLERLLGFGCQSRRIDLPAERRHLDRLRSELDVCKPEPAADDPAVAKQLLDLVGMRRRADVEVLRTPVQQQVTHAAADEICDVIVLVKPVENFERVRIDVAPRDRVLGSRHDGRLNHQSRL